MTEKYDHLRMADNPPIPDKLYTVREAAEKWDISVNAIYQEINAGRLKAKPRRGTTRGYIITKQIMDEWIDSQLVDAYDVIHGRVM